MHRDKGKANEILTKLSVERPKFHGRQLHGEKEAGAADYSLEFLVLQWLINNVPLGGETLETGCGYSSVIFAALSLRHTVISPFPEEQALVKTWCQSNSVDIEHLNFIVGTSQEILPTLAIDKLDLILIDGDHAFPAPFIDWYYTADHLRVGGYLVVDDTHFATGKILREFLIRESDDGTQRWRYPKEINNTAIFNRSTEGRVAKGVTWNHQPFSSTPTGPMWPKEGFYLNASQSAKFHAWAAEKPPREEVLGERFRYCFTPTSIGTLVGVECLVTNTILNLSEDLG